MIRILQDTRPHEIYNLAAQSHVQGFRQGHVAHPAAAET
jgi:GDP-D-mannose dehydratase